MNDDTAFLFGFTDFEALNTYCNDKLRLAVLSYEDILEHLHDKTSDGRMIQGFVINPGSNELRLSHKDVELIEKAKESTNKEPKAT